jgi:hypothetical protein
VPRARARRKEGSVAAAVNRGGSARVVLTMTNATANRATIALNGWFGGQAVIVLVSHSTAPGVPCPPGPAGCC